MILPAIHLAQASKCAHPQSKLPNLTNTIFCALDSGSAAHSKQHDKLRKDVSFRGGVKI